MLSERRIQVIEQGAASLDSLAVVVVTIRNSTHECRDACGFRAAKALVLAIDVVNDLSDLMQAFVLTETKALEHRFEGAVLSVMSELSSKHVKGNCAFDRFAFGNEIEARTLINELFD